MAKVKTPALGILLPIQLGNTGYFSQGFDILTQVKSNLENLILTRKGERIMQPSFGCDIYSFIFEPITDDNISQIKASIQHSVNMWMPYLNITNVEINKLEDQNTVMVKVTFSLNVTVNITDSVTLLF